MKEYPGLRAVAIEMAHDNGAIHRYRTQRQFLAQVRTLLNNVPQGTIMDAEAFLGGLSDEQIETVAFGEDTEQQEIMSKAPAGVETLIQQIFNDVVCA